MLATTTTRKEATAISARLCVVAFVVCFDGHT
jgi:hypothetical protein